MFLGKFDYLKVLRGKCGEYLMVAAKAAIIRFATGEGVRSFIRTAGNYLGGQLSGKEVFTAEAEQAIEKPESQNYRNQETFFAHTHKQFKCNPKIVKISGLFFYEQFSGWNLFLGQSSLPKNRIENRQND